MALSLPIVADMLVVAIMPLTPRKGLNHMSNTNVELFTCTFCNTNRPVALVATGWKNKCKYCLLRDRKAFVVKSDISGYGKKLFMIEMMTDKPVVNRVFYTNIMVNGKKTKFDSKNHFQGYQVSAFINRMVGAHSWGDITTDNAEVLLDIMNQGYGDYVCIFASWADRKGRAILVHKDADIKKLKDLRIFTRLSVITESTKAVKYLNRLFAPVSEKHDPIWGKEQAGSWDEVHQECIIELESGVELIVKYVNLKNLNPEQVANKDGHIGMNAKAINALKLLPSGLMPSIGDSWKVTLHTERLMGKGHVIYQPGQTADIVIYGGKKHVFGDRFYFSVLSPLHSGNPHTDIQSVTNFKLSGLVVKLARNYMLAVYNQMKSHEGTVKLLKQVLRPKDTVSDVAFDDTGKDDSTWLFERAMKLRVGFMAFPALYRRAVKYMTTKVMDVADMRVPMNFNDELAVATSSYVSGDPFAIDEDGTPNLELSQLNEGEICIPHLPAGIWVVVYRQPNENSNAWYLLKNVHIPELMEAKGKSVCFIGRGSHKVLSRLGGGDMDDNFVIVHNPEWVEHFKTLSYPETPKLAAIESEAMPYDPEFAEFDEAYEGKFDMDVYGPVHMQYQISAATDRGLVGIGPAVNLGLIDFLLSDPANKASMLADLQERGEQEKFIKNLTGRTDWTSAEIMTNLEIIIDAAVKDPALLQALNEAVKKLGANDLSHFIKRFHSMTLVYPKSMANRIPASRQAKGGYVLARSIQCRDQETIRRMQKHLENVARKNEWSIAKKAEPIISAMMPPSTDRIKRIVNGKRDEEGNWNQVGSLRGFWSKLWADHREAIAANDGVPTDDILNMISDQLEEKLEMMSEQDLREVVIELYRTTYTGTKQPVADPATGKFRGFGDGLLWSNKLGNLFMTMLHEAQLTGLMLPVDLSIRLDLARKPSVSVKLKEGNVYLMAGNVAVGRIASMAEGVYSMSYGFIELRNSDPSLKGKPGISDMLANLTD